MYVLHCLHEHASSLHDLINFLNLLKESLYLILFGTSLNKTLSFEELLEKDGSVTIHIINLQVIATEMFQVYRNVSPKIVAELFHK